MDLISAFFLAATITVVPAGLFLVQPLSAFEKRWIRWILYALPLAAASVALSFAWLPSAKAAAWSFPWVLLCLATAMGAVIRLTNGGLAWGAPLCTTAALLYLLVGGVWLFFSRAGIATVGFHEPIVLLTAIHFTFSGFGASLIAAKTAAALSEHPRWQSLIVITVLTGMPVIAAGFVFSPTLKLVGVALFAMELCAIAAGQWMASRTKPRPSQILLRISSLSILVGITLAFVYEASEFAGLWWLSIPQMARWHGSINAIGFTFCGLLGWLSAPDQSHRQETKA